MTPLPAHAHPPTFERPHQADPYGIMRGEREDHLFRTAMIVGTVAAFAGPVAAQTSGFYVRGDIGIALGTSSNEFDTAPGAYNESLGNNLIWGKPEPGVIFDLGVGYRFAPFLRVEGSVGYIPSMVFNGTFNDPPSSTTRANISALVGLASAYIDFAGLFGPLPGNIQPFVLGGVGFATVTNGAESDYRNGQYANTFSGMTVTNVAWTAGAGVGVPLSRRLTFDLTYRYLDLGQRFVGPVLTSASGSQEVLTLDRANLQVHTIMVGLRFEL